MKYFEKIDRQFMELVNRFDKAVSTFHAFRSLWAALAANREQCGLTRESLETHQCRQLIEILSTAELMRDHLGIKWCTVLSGDADGDGIYLGKSLRSDADVHAFVFKNGKTTAFGNDSVTIADLINAGWTLDGPVRTSRL